MEVDCWNSSSCCQEPLQGGTETKLNLWLVPMLLSMSIVGNSLNVLVYRHPFLKSSSTVQLLLFRSVSHLLFSVSLIPNFLYAFQNRYRAGVYHPVFEEDVFERIYWACLKWMMWASNVFNTIAVWLTLCVTMQMVILVEWPVWGKSLLSREHSRPTIVLVCIFSALLHLLLLTHRYVLVSSCVISERVVFVHRYLSSSDMLWEQLYSRVSAIFVSVGPLLVLLPVCAWMGRKTCVGSSPGVPSSLRTRCVLNLAAVTTLTHLLFEFPSVGDSGAFLQTLVAVTNLLSTSNASFSFFFYFLTSTKFRELSLHYCGCQRLLEGKPKGEGARVTAETLLKDKDREREDHVQA